MHKNANASLFKIALHLKFKHNVNKHINSNIHIINELNFNDIINTKQLKCCSFAHIIKRIYLKIIITDFFFSVSAFINPDLFLAFDIG